MFTKEIIDILISGLELAASRGAFCLEESANLFAAISEGADNEDSTDETPVVSEYPTSTPETVVTDQPIETPVIDPVQVETTTDPTSTVDPVQVETPVTQYPTPVQVETTTDSIPTVDPVIETQVDPVQVETPTV